MIKLSEYLDVFIENLLKSRLFDFLLLNSIIFRGDYPQIQDILLQQQRRIEKSINELEKNSEWDCFTIAFFGETNAGKSTIIETLRILLKEETKREQQRKFNEIQNNLNISEEDFYRIDNELTEIDDTFSLVEQKKKEIDREIQIENDLIIQDELKIVEFDEEKCKEIKLEFDSSVQSYDMKCKELAEIVLYKKMAMPWWLKIIYIFKRLEEEKEIFLLRNEREKFSKIMDEKINILASEIEKKIIDIRERKENLYTSKEHNSKMLEWELHNLKPKKMKLLDLKDELTKKLSQLEPFKDGVIVGDGRSDFTRESGVFIFSIGGYQVKIIDVPGIEGKETLVTDEISKAVQKSHAVFYVTNKDAPPNEGTLVKIKEHLDDQTEVWSIFNKPVTNPRQLKGELIKNEDERKALNDLNTKMQETLGKSYQKDIVIAGLTALYAVANCFVPFSPSSQGQKKFLEKLGREELLDFSRLNEFQRTLEQQIIGDVDFKIKKSNFNKANHILIGVKDDLLKVHGDLLLLEEDIVKQVGDTKHHIDSCVLMLKQSLRNNVDKVINNFKTNTRNATYERIDRDVSNDAFKGFFEGKIESGLELLQKEMTFLFEKEMKNFENDIQKSIEKLQKNLENLFDSYKNDMSSRNELSFNLNFDDMKSGINGIGLVSTSVGALILGLAQFWNPVGWGLLAVAITGLVIGAVKAVWGAFSSNFKKSEQRKTVDTNLAKISQDISEKAIENLNKVTQNLEQKAYQIKQSLDKPKEEISGFNQDLQKTIQEFSQLSNEIERQYGA